MRNIRRFAVITALALVGVIATAIGAQAVLTVRAGSVTERNVFVSQNTPWVTASSAYLYVPGAAIVVVVPAGQTRLIDARFTAESLCSGNSGWCTVRVVFMNSAGGVGELNPVAGTDFAFDSPGDNWESHAIERSVILGPGVFRLLVQAARVGAATSLRLDDWHFAVETIRP